MRNVGLPKLTKQNMEDAPADTTWVESVKSVVNSTVKQVENIRSGSQGLKLLENADVEMQEVEVQVPDAWNKLTLTAPWTNASGTAGWAKHPDGTIELRGDLATGGAFAAVATLPSTAIPSQSRAYGAADLAGNICSFSVDTSGAITAIVCPAGAIGINCRYLPLDATPVVLSCWPKFIKTKLSKVSSVLVANVFDAQTSQPLQAGQVLHPVWEMASQDGSNQIKLLNIAGLPYNRKSRVRLLIIGG